MDTRVELPLVQPFYSTYHYQAPGLAVAVDNPTIRNFFFNDLMLLQCETRFLSGYTGLELTVDGTYWTISPHLEKHGYDTCFLHGSLHTVIREMLDAGYYVCFAGVDDYYVPGKSWYRERHFAHYGLIHGHDRADKTYLLYAYDQNWRYRSFWTPQAAFGRAHAAAARNGANGELWAIRALPGKVPFLPERALRGIAAYLDCASSPSGMVRGAAAQACTALYLEKLQSGVIPLEKLDRRVLHVIWEHKRGMYERIVRVEDAFGWGHMCSERYAPLVEQAERLRMLYAAHVMRPREGALTVIRKELLALSDDERTILRALLERSKEVLAYGAVAEIEAEAARPS